MIAWDWFSRLAGVAKEQQGGVRPAGMMFKRLVQRLAMTAMAWSVAAVAAHAQTLTLKVSGSDIAASLQTALAGTAVHLHDLGPLKDGSTYAVNASSIKLPPTAGGAPGRRTYFSLPDASTTLLGRRYGYYVDHVRSTGVFVTAGADTFTISITLDAPGPALVGTCVRLTATPQPCALGDKVMPSVAWRDARIDIVAKPIVVGRSLALDIQTVTINGAFDVGKACEWPLLGGRLCAVVNRLSTRLRQQVAEQIRGSLNTPDLRAVVAAGVRTYLDTNLEAAVFGVRRVSMLDGTLSIAVALGR